MKPWTIQEACELYRIDRWAAGYFSVNEQGHVVACIDKQQIDLYEIVQEIHAAGYTLPILVRFPDILTARVYALCEVFDRAIKQHEYLARQTIAYPIKVNQQRCVVERISSSCKGRVGLEAGSKTELMAVLAQTLTGDPATIVCNGYKDREYIRLALIGQKFGKRVYIVIEQLSELNLVLEEAEKLGVEPSLGVRIRLSSLGKGRWQNTGGLKSKFGLTAAYLLELLGILGSVNALHTLKLLHFHMGSQIADLCNIRNGMQEICAYFAQLSNQGVSIEVVDVGGGVGVDYEGACNNGEFSINYSLQEYADTIVAALKKTCDQYGLPHPEIITEAGRALTAHHAVLITNVVDQENSLQGDNITEAALNLDVMHKYKLLHDEIKSGSGELIALIEQAKDYDREQKEYFKNTDLSIEQRAMLERMSALISNDLLQRIGADNAFSEDRERLQQRLADKYFCNFSIFQSMPDVWGLNQVFPIMPLLRLNEEPKSHVVLHDMTCDSDGHVEHYVHRDGLSKTLTVHSINKGESYILGVFLVGAYQETLGDIHNLFGDTHAVNVIADTKGYHFEEYEPGDRADELLSYVHYDTEELLQRYHEKLSASDLSEELKQVYFDELKMGLSGYTYLED